MLHWLRGVSAGNREIRANGMAAFVAFGAVGLLYLESPPTPAGANSVRLSNHKSSAFVLASAPVGQALANVVEAGPVPPAALVSPQSQTEQALAHKKEFLQLGRKFLEQTPDYTAQFSKQELVQDELLDEQTILLKCRHQPFSIYLKWLTGDVGREVLYVDGANDGEMIVHAGGWKARLPALSISPDSSIAMSESRYPVTSAGLLALVDIMLKTHEDDQARSNVQRCEQLQDQEFDGRMCSVFVVEYKDAQSSPVYRKSIALLDKEWRVPLYTRNFGWPAADAPATAAELDDATLIEFYTFTDVQFGQKFADADFDRANEEFRFR